MKKLLFVCTGNTCRSPMAKAIMDKHIVESALNGIWCAQSAGLMALDGERMQESAFLALRELDIDPMEHRAQRLTPELIAYSDCVLAMEARQVEAIKAMSPQANVYTLKGFAFQTEACACDISDPYGKPLGVYIQCAGEIEMAIRRVVSRLLQG